MPSVSGCPAECLKYTLNYYFLNFGSLRAANFNWIYADKYSYVIFVSPRCQK